MFYDFEMTITADTKESAPVTQELKLTAGVIHLVEVRFKYGPNFMVGVRIYHEEHQLYPTNPDSDIRDDGRGVTFPDNFPLTTEPYSLKVRAYSPDTVYPHTIYIRVGVLPEEIVTPLISFSGLFRKFFQLVGIGK